MKLQNIYLEKTLTLSILNNMESFIATFVSKTNEDDYLCLEFRSKPKENYDAYNGKAKELFSKINPLLKDKYDLLLVNHKYFDKN